MLSNKKIRPRKECQWELCVLLQQVTWTVTAVSDGPENKVVVHEHGFYNLNWEKKLLQPQNNRNVLERGRLLAMHSSDVLPVGPGAAELFTSFQPGLDPHLSTHSTADSSCLRASPQPCTSVLLIQSLWEENIDFFSVCLLWANWEKRSAGIKASTHFAVQFITFKQFTTQTW